MPPCSRGRRPVNNYPEPLATLDLRLGALPPGAERIAFLARELKAAVARRSIPMVNAIEHRVGEALADLAAISRGQPHVK